MSVSLDIYHLWKTHWTQQYEHTDSPIRESSQKLQFPSKFRTAPHKFSTEIRLQNHHNVKSDHIISGSIAHKAWKYDALLDLIYDRMSCFTLKLMVVFFTSAEKNSIHSLFQMTKKIWSELKVLDRFFYLLHTACWYCLVTKHSPASTPPFQ